MAGVLNTTARQFNLKAHHVKTKSFVTVRLAPGLNDVPNETWNKFKGNAYVNERIKVGDIKHGKAIDDMLKTEEVINPTKVKEVGDTAGKPVQKNGEPKSDGGPPSLATE